MIIIQDLEKNVIDSKRTLSRFFSDYEEEGAMSGSYKYVTSRLNSAGYYNSIKYKYWYLTKTAPKRGTIDDGRRTNYIGKIKVTKEIEI